MKKKIKKVCKNVLPVLIDKKGRMNSEMKAWITESLGDRTQVRSVGTLEEDGHEFRMYQAVGLNASALAANYAKRFWSERKRKGCVYTVYEDGTYKVE